MSRRGRPRGTEREAFLDRPWFPWAATAAFWVSLTSINVAAAFLRSPGVDAGLRFRLWLFPQLVLGLAWILLSPIAIVAVRRRPLHGPGWKRSVPVHLFLAALLGVSTVVLFQLGGEALRPAVRSAAQVASAIAWSIRFNIHECLLYYVVVLAATSLAEEARARRDRELAASRMKEALAEARLDALRFRLQPEFILSTLRM